MKKQPPVAKKVDHIPIHVDAYYAPLTISKASESIDRSMNKYRFGHI